MLPGTVLLLGACAEDASQTAYGGGGYTNPDAAGSDASTGIDAAKDSTAPADAKPDAVDSGGTDGGGVCVPKTCAQLGAECGNAPDGCGGKITCGTCDAGKQCGGGGQNKCGTNDCVAKTCIQVSASCGYASDGCADVTDCGKCPPPGTCGGGGKENQCGCTAKTCAQLGASCGSVPDGCGGKVDCGACPAGEVCGGGGTANQCGKGTCAAKSCAQLGASCGYVSDGCGTAVDCGKCAPPNVCGGAGIASQCGCTPQSCVQLGASCGPMPNGCGQTVDCGTCPAGEVCGGDGIAHQCGCKCSIPHATASCNKGVCTLVSCDAGWGDCDGDKTNGCELQIDVDPNNCGACGQVCSFTNATGSCNAGKCEMGACSAGFSDCNANGADGCEQVEDAQHCGSCTNDCTATTPPNVVSSSCNAGQCAVGQCAASHVDQNGTWSDGCECTADNAAASCSGASATSVAIGATASASGTLVPNGQADWYAFTFAGNNSCSFHPRVALQDNSGTGLIRVEVTTDCSAALACKEGGTSGSHTEWEFTWSATCGSHLALDPLKKPAQPTTVYVKVYATGASTGCLPYSLTASN